MDPNNFQILSPKLIMAEVIVKPKDLDVSKEINFLRSLGITTPNDLKTLAPESRLKLLNDAIKQFTFKIPFQNVTLMSQSAEKRCLPSLEDLTKDILAGKGGMCYTNNTYFMLCLEALGFDVCHVAASVSLPHSHIIMRVDNVARFGDSYLVEVGCGYPSFAAIDMDFQLESPVFKDSFCTYKLVKTAEKAGGYAIYERWQKVMSGRPITPQNLRGEDESWFRFYDFTLEPRQLEFFSQFISPLYIESAGMGPFHSNIRISIFPGGKALTLNTLVSGGEEKIRKLVLTREKDDGTVRDEFLTDDVSEIKRCLDSAISTFPVLKDFLENALFNYREV